MAEMSSLLEIFQEGGAGPRDLAHRLRSELAKPGLERFLAVLDAGIADSGGGRLGFQSWTPDQIAAVLAVARLIVPALLGTSGPPLFLLFSHPSSLCFVASVLCDLFFNWFGNHRSLGGFLVQLSR